MHTKPGYIAVCEEYERELAEANLNPEEIISKDDESGENERDEKSLSHSEHVKPAPVESGQKSESKTAQNKLQGLSERRKLKLEKRMKT